MSTFIRDFIEREKINRRNFLLASAMGAGSLMLPGSLRRAVAADGTAMAWSYRDRASAYWNAIVSGGEAYVDPTLPLRTERDYWRSLAEGYANGRVMRALKWVNGGVRRVVGK